MQHHTRSEGSAEPRVVVVTGASGGIGRATARAFGARGDTVALLARGSTGLEAAREDVERAGGRAAVYTVDTSDGEALERVATQIEDELGEIDVWVNNAFTAVFGRFTDISAEEFERVVAVTFFGFVNGTRTALRRMRPRDRGCIVQVGSALGYRGIPLQSAYCASKHALTGLHESLRTELLHERSHVRVTLVTMPGLNTPQFTWVRSKMPHRARPVAPVYQPEVAAEAIVYAADHPRRRGYWVGTSTVGTILANRVAPGLLDRYLARTGFSSQQTDDDQPSDSPDNLWQPADGEEGSDFGAHGRFDDEAHSVAPQVWLSRHRGAALAAAGLALGASVGAARARG